MSLVDWCLSVLAHVHYSERELVRFSLAFFRYHNGEQRTIAHQGLMVSRDGLAEALADMRKQAPSYGQGVCLGIYAHLPPAPGRVQVRELVWLSGPGLKTVSYGPLTVPPRPPGPQPRKSTISPRGSGPVSLPPPGKGYSRPPAAEPPRPGQGHGLGPD